MPLLGLIFFSMIIMLFILNKRLNGLPLKEWTVIFLGLIVATIISGFSCWGFYGLISSLWVKESLLLQGVNLLFSCLIALGIFLLFTIPLKLPELSILLSKINAKISKS